MATTKTISIQEYATSSGNLRVDRDNCVIRGVKLLGEASANPPPRDNLYPKETRQRAIAILEGARCYVDHPTQPNKPRSYGEALGRHRNVREEGDGLYGDFHYNPKHHLAEQLLWDAEKAPENVAFSINGDGRCRREGGRNLVEEITNLRSVDLVPQGGTVSGLFENRSNEVPNPTVPVPGKKTVRQVLERLVLRPEAKKWLLEMDGGMDDEYQPMSGGPDLAAESDPGHGQDVFDAIKAMIQPKLDEASADGETFNPKYIKRLEKIIALCGEASGSDGGDEGSDSGTSGTSEEGSAQEGHQPAKPEAGTQSLREELAVRDLLEEAGLTFGKTEARKAFIKSLVPLQESDRKALIEERKTAAASQPAKGPRSQSPGAARHIQEAALPKDADGWAKRLLS